MCLMPANPDISGIGVRIAIYLQNLLCFFPAFWAIWDGRVSAHELQSAETQSTTNLVLAFAILISCIVQAFTLGLTSYHAAIVLSLSWMNNTNAFIYFLLYVRYKCQGGRPQVEPNWASWGAHVKDHIRGIVGLPLASRQPAPDTQGATNGPWASNDHPELEARDAKTETQPNLLRKGGTRRGAKALFKRVALLLGSPHLTLMAALGIWLWSDPRSFGLPDASCAIDVAHLAVVGVRVPFASEPLRIVSLVLYSLFLIPGLNLLLPIAAFLWLYISHAQRISAKQSEIPTTRDGAQTEWLALGRAARAYRRAVDSPVFPISAGLVFLLAVNLIFIADIELVLRHNRALQSDEGEETEWGFGQILAILLVLLPLRDVVEMILARRLNQQWGWALRERNVGMMLGLIQDDVDPSVPGEDGVTALEVSLLQKNWTAFLLIVTATFRRGDDLPRFHDGRTAFETVITLDSVEGTQALLQGSANPNTIFDDGKTPLELASLRKSWEVVQALVNGKADVNTVFQDGQTALQHAGRADQWTLVHALLEAHADFENLCIDDRTLLRAVVDAEAWPVVEALVAKGANPDTASRDGESLLQMASYAKEWGVVCSIVNADHDINIVFQDRDIWPSYKTALEAAYMGDNEQVVRLLLSKGADPNAKMSSSSKGFLLHQACYDGDQDLVQCFLEWGADPNLQGQLGSALQAACWGGSIEIAKLLLDRNVDPNLEGGDSGSALQAACSGGHFDIVELLLDHNADPNIGGPGKDGPALCIVCRDGLRDETIVELLLNRNADPNCRDGWGKSPLHVACSSGIYFDESADNIRIIELLLQHGADVNLQDDSGWSPLQYACWWGYLDAAEALLGRGADPNLQWRDGGSVLQTTCRRRDPRFINLLLDHGADPDLRSGDGVCALQLVSKINYPEIVELLLDRNANPNAQDGGGGTVLQEACAEGHTKVVKVLLDGNADPNIQGGRYGSALQASCSAVHPNTGFELVELLLDHNADPNIQGGGQGSALQLASSRGSLDIAIVLIEKGANLNVRGGELGSPLALARAGRHHILEKLLLANGAEE